MDPNQQCFFCHLPREKIWIQTDESMAFLDGYPVSEGHTLVIPKRHVTSLFDLPESEQAALWTMVAKVRRELESKFKPDAFNVGVNDGFAAGQTVRHAHIHVIPRRKGDVLDPKGGIRCVIPEKAKYW